MGAELCARLHTCHSERSAVRNLEDWTQRTTCGKDSGFRVFDKVSVLDEANVFDEVNEHCSTLRSELPVGSTSCSCVPRIAPIEAIPKLHG